MDISQQGGFLATRVSLGVGETVRVELMPDATGTIPVALYGAIVRVVTVGVGAAPGFALRWRAARSPAGTDATELAGFLLRVLGIHDASIAWHEQMKSHVHMFGDRVPPTESGGFAAVPLPTPIPSQAVIDAVSRAVPAPVLGQQDDDVMDAFRPAPAGENTAKPASQAAASPPRSAEPDAPAASSLGKIGRRLLAVTDKLLRREQPGPLTGKDLVSPDGWFYHPDDDGPLHVGREGVALKTGNARANVPPLPKRRKPATPVVGQAAVTKGGPSRAKASQLPAGGTGELCDVDVPCSFLWARALCGGRVLRAGARAVVIAVEGIESPRADSAVELNLPVYVNGIYHTVSIEGVVHNEPAWVGDRLCFMMWVKRVNEWRLADSWQTFLADEKLAAPHPSNEDSGPVDPAQARRKASA